mgnify:CR=1 FL=1
MLGASGGNGGAVRVDGGGWPRNPVGAGRGNKGHCFPDLFSGALLRRNAIHHESANEPNSHYYQYVIAQDNPNNNVGVAAEGFVKPPEIGLEGFDQALRQLLEAKVKAIHDAVSAEPCGGHVNRDHSGNCEFLGNVNLPPYQPCP